MTALDILRQELEATLPAMISRDEIHKHTGGLYTKKTMQNFDCQGKGPKLKVKIDGRKVCYVKSSLVDWIISRSQQVKGKHEQS